MVVHRLKSSCGSKGSQRQNWDTKSLIKGPEVSIKEGEFFLLLVFSSVKLSLIF